MQRIEAIIRPERLQFVRNALEKVGYPGIMVTQIEGHGIQKGVTQQWRGEKYKLDLLPKTKIEITVEKENVDKVVNAIIQSAKTGSFGDGKIFIYDTDGVIRIRTGEEGTTAIT
ncbi:MAG: P-II family nitrogen regulator [Candidatus Brocadiales bacterium]|nr:P-II family nitrogen regulator [Candidatus Brocadiales bacterium]